MRIVARVPGNTSLHDVAPDGRVLIARTDDRGGVSVRVPGETTERDLAWLDSPNVAGLSRDGRSVLFWEGGVGGGAKASVYLRGTDGSAAVRLGDGVALALAPDGRRAIAYTASRRISTSFPPALDWRGGSSAPGLTLSNVKWLPDSRRVVARRAVGPGPRTAAPG